MSILLGIDTGGTYTDAVLLDSTRGVISAAKAITTKHDLSVGIQNAVQKAIPQPPPDIQLVSLSSTLATNAIVEGKGSPICLLLIGYDPRIVADMGLERFTASKRIIFIQGGHTINGDEQHPLDIDAARQAILSHAPQVAAFAISGYFGVRNPVHELRVKRLARRLTGLPVTCGHELTANLNAPRRALTVALNARLIRLSQQLILAVGEMLAIQGIHAPLMVVKGDGSLMDAKGVLERPVETILSGPAASVIGARYLSNVGDVFVIDMGGTTTDIAALRNGSPALNLEGAKVGGYQTMVEAVDVHTIGLGGDSEIHLDKSGNLCVGPRRVVPLSLLAMQYPMVVDTLRRQSEEHLDRNVGRFVMRERPLGVDQNSITSSQQKIWEHLSDGPASVTQLFYSPKSSATLGRMDIEDLTGRGLIVASGFTPTDAVHVLGQHRSGSVEAAELGAELWARRLDISREEFCQRVVQQVVIQAGRALIESALVEEGGLSESSWCDLSRLFVDRALGAKDAGSFSVTFSLRRSLIGIGAPAVTYLSPLAEKLKTQLCIPEHAEVANAIGAVASGVVQTVHALIEPLWRNSLYRAYLPFGVRDFQKLTDAIAYAKRVVSRLARNRAHQAGASVVKVHIDQHDRTAQVYGLRQHIETKVIATAIGRPRLKE